jgi:hypothetical protein
MKLPYKLLLGVLVIMLLSSLLINATVHANTIGFGQYHGITWTYGNQVVQNWAGAHWTAHIYTWVDYPVITMSNIGHSWWTVREWCDGELTGNIQGGPLGFTNRSSHSVSMTIEKKSCQGTRIGTSQGNHHFYKWPHTHWYKGHSHGASLP